MRTYRRYIESKFTEDSSWDNYGEWQIDHIIQVKNNNQSMEEVIVRVYWSKIQPLWKAKTHPKVIDDIL